MFLPLRDALPSMRFPWMTAALIALNVLVYVVGLLPADTQVEGSTSTISRHDLWVSEYGAIPCELLGNCTNQAGQVVIEGGIIDPTPKTVVAEVDQHAPALTLVTSIFLHGGIIHLLFNMLFLWVYGNNVEDAMHPVGFLAFYVFAGMASGLAQALVGSTATVPQVGASGAIAAVIGGYLFLYPRARVLTMVIPPIFLWLPAWFVAGTWGLLQLLATWNSIFAPTALDGGVAYMAHFSGFALGLATIAFIADRRNPAYDELYGRGPREGREEP
jgi:membrane associated rhomboid family serine protease